MSTRIRLALQQDLRAVSYYGLFAADGQRIAGNVWTLPKSVRVDGEPRALGAAGFHPGARALAHRLQDGRILFVGYDAKTLTGLRLILFRTLLWSGAAVLIGGVALGALFGSGPLRRVKGIGDTMVRVAGGDLATRLPVSVRGDEIDALSALVNTMMGETERLIGELKSIGDNLAHDLRTPLNHLRGHLYRALELWGEESPDAQRERLVSSPHGVVRVVS